MNAQPQNSPLTYLAVSLFLIVFISACWVSALMLSPRAPIF